VKRVEKQNKTTVNEYLHAILGVPNYRVTPTDGPKTFPIGGASVVVLILSSALLVDLAGLFWFRTGELSNQIYGITFDGVGAILLTDLYGDWDGRPEETIQSRWGLLFLTTGFVLVWLSYLIP
jgi:hypothetical protein